MSIQLPQQFTDDHKQIARRFIQGDTFPQQERVLLIEAFDILHNATIMLADEEQRFVTFYAQTVEARFAQQYLHALQQGQHVAAVAEQLRAQVSRQIMPMLKAIGALTPDDPLSFYLLAYCLYWWYAFARGYAFEIEIFQDLDAAGVRYVAHDVLDERERRSPFDLIVLGFRGDIKTSTYFFDAVRTSGLLHDFYIARLIKQRK